MHLKTRRLVYTYSLYDIEIKVNSFFDFKKTMYHFLTNFKGDFLEKQPLMGKE